MDITSQTPVISHTSGHAAPYSPTGAQNFYKCTWVRAKAGAVSGDWSVMRGLVVGKTYDANGLKAALQAGGEVYVAPGTISGVCDIDMNNVQTSLIPATGTVTINPPSDSGYFIAVGSGSTVTTLTLGASDN